MIVDELADQYVNNELQGEERERAENYFLSTPERQTKLQFATELLRHAADVRGAEVTPAQRAAKPGLLEKLRAFGRSLSLAPVPAIATALILAVGLSYFIIIRPGTQGTANYAAINLSISTSERAAGATSVGVKLPDSGLRINLAVPEQSRNAKDYRVRLSSGAGVVRDLKIEDRNDQSVTFTVPATSLTRGSYVVQLFRVKDDGTEDRIRGSYYFDIE